VKLDNPLVVQWEYASEERLAKRNRTYSELTEGVRPEDAVFDAVRGAEPRSFLDVGCGMGALAARVQRELGIDVDAVDISPRMVALTKARGVRAEVADVQELPFEDRSFDCVGANWVLYHVPDVDRGVRELARVLRPGGRLIAGAFRRDNMKELWDLLGAAPFAELTFDYDNGEAKLAPHFATVERRDVTGTVVFPDRAAMHEFVAATMNSHLAVNIPELTEPFPTRSTHCVFVATKA
jgi:SAM-dependent methyltransferase